MSDDEVDIGDVEPDDAHDDDDGNIDWSRIDELDQQMQAIHAIEDEDERTAAAEKWAAEMAGEPDGK